MTVTKLSLTSFTEAFILPKEKVVKEDIELVYKKSLAQTFKDTYNPKSYYYGVSKTNEAILCHINSKTVSTVSFFETPIYGIVDTPYTILLTPTSSQWIVTSDTTVSYSFKGVSRNCEPQTVSVVRAFLLEGCYTTPTKRLESFKQAIRQLLYTLTIKGEYNKEVGILSYVMGNNDIAFLTSETVISSMIKFWEECYEETLFTDLSKSGSWG